VCEHACRLCINVTHSQAVHVQADADFTKQYADTMCEILQVLAADVVTHLVASALTGSLWVAWRRSLRS
jgi:hypothetical protein